VSAEISERRSSLVFHVGDVSYGDGKGEVWHAFMQGISAFASSTPYMVGVGNHDYDYSKHDRKRHNDPSNAVPFRPTWAKFASDSRGECGVALQARFMMPDNRYLPHISSHILQQLFTSLNPSVSNTCRPLIVRKPHSRCFLRGDIMHAQLQPRGPKVSENDCLYAVMIVQLRIRPSGTLLSMASSTS
jgi:hypothetical protein